MDACIPHVFGVNTYQYYQVLLWLWQIFKCKSNTCRKRVDQFGARMERLIVGFRERLNNSRTCLVICLMNFKAWLCSELCQNGKCLYVQFCINQYPGQCLHACAKPLQCAIVQCVCYWRHRMDFVLWYRDMYHVTFRRSSLFCDNNNLKLLWRIQIWTFSLRRIGCVTVSNSPFGKRPMNAVIVISH